VKFGKFSTKSEEFFGNRGKYETEESIIASYGDGSPC